MAQQSIEIGLQTPIAAASALKKAGYGVTSGGKPVNVSETNDKEKELKDGKDAIHTKKWDRCVKKVKASGKSEESAYKICSSSIKNAGVQSKHQQKTGKQYAANRKETNEGETLFDVFPELNQCESQEGGEVKDIKMKTDHIKKTEKPKDVKYKKIQRDPKMESILSKKEILEAIRSAEPAPSKPTPETPTITPTKPGQKPKRQNPFRPKPGPNPRPKGSLPAWLSSDKLGIGKKQSVSEDIMEIQKLIKNLI